MKNIFLLLSLLFTIGCVNKEQLFNKNVTGIVHQCNNIWQDYKTLENSHVLAASTFLEENKIEFIDLEGTNTGEFILCTFCYPCPSDIIINFKVREEDLEAVLAFGFEEN